MSIENLNGEEHSLPTNGAPVDQNSSADSIQSSKPKNKWIIPVVFVTGILATILFFKAGDLKKLWASPTTDSLKCGLSQTQIYEKYKNSVVLVANSYVYEVSVKGSAPFYLTITENGELAPYDENVNNPITITGTGFFVSKDGKLVTNRHVASPWVTNQEEAFSAIKQTVSYMIPDDVDPAQIKTYITQHWTDEITEGNEEEWEAVQATDSTKATDSTASEITINIPEQKSSNPSSTDDIVVKGKIVRLGIAMHNSKVKEISDFIPCEFITEANDPNVDVAIIQTLSHNLPGKVKNIIDLNLVAKDDSEIKPGTKAIMIGYPMGMQLAGTQKGVKVQVYEGEVNKESDGFAIQYNITSTHGASGSPVFDDCGRLVAVNFAGYDQTQGFNFGVVAKHALALYQGD